MMWGTQPCISRALRAAGEASYTPNAVDFDGTNDYLSTAGALTGVSDGRVGSIAFAINRDVDDTTEVIFHINGTGVGDLTIRINSSEGLQILAYAAGSETVKLNIITPAGSVAAASGWVPVMISWDLTTGGAESSCLYLGDTDSQTVSTRVGGSDIDYTGVTTVGASQGGGNKLNGQLSELYVNLVEYIDFSVEANRRKFFLADGAPVDKGADGSTPTGTAPAVYLKNAAATFGTNSGTGGDFTITGSLTDVTPPP